MTMEQKAKAYDKALERAKILYNDKNEIGYANAESVLEEVFPLLKESEDERIKKTLINFFSKGAEYDSSTNGIKDRNIIAWLEKQGIEKLTVKPKFKVGDWIIYSNEEVDIITGFDDSGYFVDKECYIPFNCEGNMRLFTIQDAKELMKIERKPTQETEPFEAEHGKYYYCIKDYFCGGRKQASKGDVIQALRGLPIMGLKDASEYFLPVNSIKCNSAWSEEDYAMIEAAINLAHEYGRHGLWVWLKSLKQRATWKPSDEQIKAFEHFVRSIGESGYASPYENNTKLLYSLLGQLKKL